MPNQASYDAEHITNFFNAYGEREWNRFGLAPLDRWVELKALLERHGCDLLTASVANHLTTSHSEEMNKVCEQEPEVWERILEWEQKMCQEPGNLDGGTHIIAVVSRK